MSRLLRIEGNTYAEINAGIYRVISDGNSLLLKQPPAVVVMFSSTSRTSGGRVTNLSFNGWDNYFKRLNGDDWAKAVHYELAMFNSRDGKGWPQMHSLSFAGNLVRAVPTNKDNWMRILTRNYVEGPNGYEPTYNEDPLSVHRFTVWGRKSHIIKYSHRKFYYPLVSKHPVYMETRLLEPISLNMNPDNAIQK